MRGVAFNQLGTQLYSCGLDGLVKVMLFVKVHIFHVGGNLRCGHITTQL